MKVADIVRDKGARVDTISPSDTGSDAIRRFVELQVRLLVVVDEGRVCGLLSVRDLLSTLDRLGAAALTASVAGMMTESFASVEPDASLEEAERMFIERRVHHLPVIEDGRLAGLVTPADVLGGHISDVQYLNDHLLRYIHCGG